VVKLFVSTLAKLPSHNHHLPPMMPTRLRFAIACLATLLHGCGAASPPAAGASPAPARSTPIRHVILVTIDGLPPAAYLEPDAHGLKVPTLRRMLAGGAASSGAESVFPSVTYPAHTSLITGAHPATHGIVTNTQFDPLDQNQAGWRWYAEDIRVPTLLDAARAAGLRSGSVAWPVTVGAPADFLVPDYWRAGIAEDVKLLRALSTPGLLEAAAARFPRFR
jgi:predicted AlkP superfamily pyrophosphatase or phosphodiesterase